MLTTSYEALINSLVRNDIRPVVSSEQEKISDYVRRVIRDKGLSYRQVAQNSGGAISHATVSDIINERNRNLSTATLVGIAKGLGVPEEEIFAVARGKALDTEEAFTGEFALLFKGFHDLSPEDQAEMRAMVRMLATEVERRRPRNPPSKVKGKK